MHLASTSLSAATAVSGAVGLVSVLLLVASRTPLGSPLFFGLILIFVLAYCAMLWRVWHEDATDRKAIRLALIFAVLFRLPLALAPVGADSDMVAAMREESIKLNKDLIFVRIYTWGRDFFAPVVFTLALAFLTAKPRPARRGTTASGWRSKRSEVPAADLVAAAGRRWLWPTRRHHALGVTDNTGHGWADMPGREDR
jgi:hypothetical protein